MKENRRLTKVRNQGIDRKNVLSSGRPLPSAKGWEHLAQQCELQHAYLFKCTKNRKDYEERTRQRKKRIKQSHARDPSRIDEVPNTYLLDQKLRNYLQAEKAALELMEALQRQYKNATGSAWKPKPNANKPIKGITRV